MTQIDYVAHDHPSGTAIVQIRRRNATGDFDVRNFDPNDAVPLD